MCVSLSLSLSTPVSAYFNVQGAPNPYTFAPPARDTPEEQTTHEFAPFLPSSLRFNRKKPTQLRLARDIPGEDLIAMGGASLGGLELADMMLLHLLPITFVKYWTRT